MVIAILFQFHNHVMIEAMYRSIYVTGLRPPWTKQWVDDIRHGLCSFMIGVWKVFSIKVIFVWLVISMISSIQSSLMKIWKVTQLELKLYCYRSRFAELSQKNKHYLIHTYGVLDLTEKMSDMNSNSKTVKDSTKLMMKTIEHKKETGITKIQTSLSRKISLLYWIVKRACIGASWRTWRLQTTWRPRTICSLRRTAVQTYQLVLYS